jgi:mono/diheme cytochrome c family protein
MRFLVFLILSILSFVMNAAVHAAPFTDGALDNYQPNLEMGERLFNAAACGSCHQTKNEAYNPEKPSLGGGIEIDNTTYGLIRVPNISGDENGIGAWKRSRFLNALIHGVSEGGGEYIPIHPYEFYAGIKPEHAIDILEYIKTSLPKVNRPNDPNKLTLRLFRWRKNPNRYSFDPEKIIKNREEEGLGSDPSNSASWGKYLVEHVSACGSCHTGRRASSFMLEPSQTFKATHSALGEQEIIELSIPKDGSIADVIPSRNDFEHKFLGKGLTVSGSRPMNGSMERVVKSLSLLSSSDKAAIHQYLKNLPAPEPFEVKSSCDAPVSPVTVSGPKGKDLTKSVDGWLKRQCQRCHIRGAAPAQAALLSRASSIATDSSLIAAGRPNQSLLYKSISGATGVAQMPPSGSVSEVDKKLVEDWIEALEINQNAVAPIDAVLQRDASRDHVPRESAFEAVQKHIQSTDAADQRYMRYFSFQSYFNGHLPCQTDKEFNQQHLKPYVAALNKLINSLSWEHEMVRAEPLKNAPFIFAVNIDDLGWTEAQWDTLMSGDIPGLPTPEPYPYGANTTGKNANLALREIANLTKSDTPIIRADWFVAYAGEPFRYKYMLNLPDTVQELEQKMLKVNLDQMITAGKGVIRLGFLEGSSGVSLNNRLLDRVDLPSGGYYWVSYDFKRPAAADSRRVLKEYPIGPKNSFPHGPETFDHDGGEMLFSLPNGLQGYYLTDETGGYLDKGPTDVVFHKGDKYISPLSGIEISNGVGCMSCHVSGIITAKDQIKDAVLKGRRLVSGQKDIFESLYASDKVISDKMANDIKIFLDAVADIDGNPGLKTERQGAGVFHEEPITNLSSIYFELVNKEKLASELGLTVESLLEKAKLLNGHKANGLLTSWLADLETRGFVSRLEIERAFQLVYAALHDQEPKHKKQQQQKLTQSNETVEAYAGETKPGRHGLTITPVKAEIKVCERAQVSVETDKDCQLQVIYPDKQSGKVVYQELPESMIGGKTLKAGEKRIIPSNCKDCPQLVANQPSPGWEVFVNCYANGTPPGDMTKRLEEHASTAVYQSAHIQFAQATEKVSEELELEAPISATAKFITLENKQAKFNEKGLCEVVE